MFALCSDDVTAILVALFGFFNVTFLFLFLVYLSNTIDKVQKAGKCLANRLGCA